MSVEINYSFSLGLLPQNMEALSEALYCFVRKSCYLEICYILTRDYSLIQFIAPTSAMIQDYAEYFYILGKQKYLNNLSPQHNIVSLIITLRSLVGTP